MTINQQNHVAEIPRAQTVMAMGGILGALAASSCCILPLTLFSLGISGAWMANFTRLAPYQPYFIAATLVVLGTGYCPPGFETHLCRRRRLRPPVAEPAGQGHAHRGNGVGPRWTRLRLPCATSFQLMNGGNQ
jgi:hypothetical protein